MTGATKGFRESKSLRFAAACIAWLLLARTIEAGPPPSRVEMPPTPAVEETLDETDSPDAPAPITDEPAITRQARPLGETSAAGPPSTRTTTEESHTPDTDLYERGPDSPVSVATASLGGVTPGETTLDELRETWGEPRKSHDEKDRTHLIYTVGPFPHVIVTVLDDTVISLLLQFSPSARLDVLTKRLGLDHLRSVPIQDPAGDVLGLAFPERGVAYTLDEQTAQDEPEKVALVLIEPVRAQAFVLRAERDLLGPITSNLRDLEAALALDPDHARAHWLKARLLWILGNRDEALQEVATAVRLAPGAWDYRLTRSAILAETEDLNRALEDTRAALAAVGVDPILQAQANYQLGNLLATPPKNNAAEAMTYHTRAIQLADPLSIAKDPFVRRQAVELLVDAHIAVARDIAIGPYQDKGRAMLKWLMRAREFADLGVNNHGCDPELRFRVARAAIRCAVPLGGRVDPANLVASAQEFGVDLMNKADDPARRQWLAWQLGLALADAMAIEHQRGASEEALAYGSRALALLQEASDQQRSLPETQYKIGRIQFRMGAIHAVYGKDHAKALTWYQTALPLLKKAQPQMDEADAGQRGDAFVSMGVSFWEEKQHREAVELTERGLRLLETAVRGGDRPASSLKVAYGNLAAMHEHLGDRDEARRYATLAGRQKASNLK